MYGVSSYRLMEGLEHSGDSLFVVRVSETLRHTLVVSKVVEVDDLLCQLQQKQGAGQF